MKRIDEQRFFTMAEAYDKMAQKLVPQYDFIQDEIIRFLGIKNCRNPVITDLGAGTGIFIEKILETNSSAVCYWIDYSEDFLNVAKDKLSKYDNKVKFILVSLDEPWESHLSSQPDFVFSMSAIHHLENNEKRALYARCYDILSDGGWFINIDEMKTLNKDAYLLNLYQWINHVEEYKSNISENEMHFYNKWKTHFDNWKIRNVDNIDRPKSKGDDLHEIFTIQMNWMKEIGFSNVDIFIKYYLWCVVGGQKQS